jgi:elongation factor Ts
VEVKCETDFVARNPDFQKFVSEVARKALASDGDPAAAMKDEVTARIASIGENIVIRRAKRFVKSGPGVVASYIHLGGKVGVLVELGCRNSATESNPALSELAKDLTLHVAASWPKALTSADVDPAVLVQEREIYAKQVQDKPPQIVEKIVDGKIKKFYSEICLVDQPYVREPKMSVTQLLNEKSKELKDTLAIRRFVRFQLGE